MRPTLTQKRINLFIVRWGSGIAVLYCIAVVKWHEVLCGHCMRMLYQLSILRGNAGNQINVDSKVIIDAADVF